MPDTVTVACKIPNGLQLRLCVFETIQELVMGGGTKEVRIARPTGEFVQIHGPAKEFGKEPKTLTMFGYALTSGVDADFMETWMAQNQKHDAVVNKLIFVQEKMPEAQAEARDNKARRSGLEPLDMSMKIEGDRKVPRDVRVPRQIQKLDLSENA